MVNYKDCPECGANKIRQSVSLCDVCEVSQRYEKRIGELQALLDLAKNMRDVAAKEREEWEATAEKAPHEQADWHETMHGSYIVSTNSKELTVSIAESLREDASVRDYKVTADQLLRAKDCLFHKVTIETEGDNLLGFKSENICCHRGRYESDGTWYCRRHDGMEETIQHKEHIVDTRFVPLDGILIRRVINGWHVVIRGNGAQSEAVYTDKEIPMGDLSAGLDSGEARALHEALWEHFQPYMRTKHRAGLVMSVQPASSLQEGE